MLAECFGTLTLICVKCGGVIFLPPPPSHPFWFSVNNAETVKAVTLAFYSIQ